MTIEGPPNPHNAPRAKVRPIAMGVDIDGVTFKKAAAWDIPRRATKMGLPLEEGAREGLAYLGSQPDVHMLGLYTVRPKWLREGQTRRQVRRHGLEVPQIVHTTNSSVEKIARLLDDAEGAGPGLSGQRIVNHQREQVVLQDDSVDKVIAAAEELLRTSPEYEDALSRFTLLAYDPKQRHRVHGTILPGIAHIVSVQSWHNIDSAMNMVRTF